MNKLDIIELARGYHQKMVASRRYIHQNAELSFCEKGTAAFISSVLDEEEIVNRSVAKTGVLAEVDGLKEGSSDTVVVLRADIDALPIVEDNDLEYRSTTGAMHACGHDLHAAWLLGAIIALNSIREKFSGKIIALFQPGEEQAPGGASLVLEEVDFSKYGTPIFIGQHVAPDIEVGGYGIRSGLYMASTDEVHVTIRGKGGHGALTQTFVDPVLAMAALIMSLQQVVSRQAPSTLPTVLSFGRVLADGATNVIPETAEIHGTLRTFSQEWRAKAFENIKTIIENVCQGYGCKGELYIPGGYPSVINDKELAARAKELLTDMVGSDKVVDLELRMTGEDFGFYCTKYRSLFLRVGVGRKDSLPTGSLHSSDFNPDEEALVYGSASMIALALDILYSK